MKLRIILILMITAVLLFAVSQESNKDIQELAGHYMKTNTVKLVSNETLRYVEGRDEMSGKTSYFLYSDDFVEIEGYQGVTTLGIILNEDLDLEKVVIISSKDTRSYIMRLKRGSFLKQFKYWNKVDELDSVTGATMSSEAVIETVQESCRIFKEQFNPDNAVGFH